MEGKSGVNFCRNEGRASSEGLAPAAANEKKSSLVKVTVSTLENSANGTSDEREEETWASTRETKLVYLF